MLSVCTRSCGKTINSKQGRSIFQWVNLMFNKVSEDRIQEVGPERACAEWLMRNGASVKWKGEKEFVKDYNKLPLKKGDDTTNFFHIQAVDATDASIMENGFPHFKGCMNIEKITFRRCNLLTDAALPQLKSVQGSLQSLEIISCGNITDKGLISLTVLSHLKTLTLQDLASVQDKTSTVHQIKTSLPKCAISFEA